MADSSLSVSTAVSLATLRNAAARFLFKAGDDSPHLGRLMRWKDWVDEVLLKLQQGLIDPAAELEVASLTLSGGQQLVNVTSATYTIPEDQSQNGVTIATPIAVPTDEVLVGVAVVTGGATWTSGGVELTSVTAEVGIQGGDTDRIMEAFELIDTPVGSYAAVVGAAHGTLTGAGTYEMLLTAAAGSDPDMTFVDSGNASVTVYVLTVPFA